MAQLIRQGRGATWILRYLVPRDLQRLAGVAEVRRSTRTSDLREAKRCAPSLEIEIRAELDTRAAAMRSPIDRLHELAADVAAGDASADVFDVAIDDHLEAIGAARGFESGTGHPRASPAEVEEVHTAARRATGEKVATVREALHLYLTEKARTAQPATVAGYRAELGDFAAWIGSHAELRRISREVAGRYVTEAIMPAARADRTKRERIGWLSAFFNWAELAGLVDSNPFHGATKRLPKPSGRAYADDGDSLHEAGVKRAWSGAELVTLLRGMTPGRTRAAFTVALWSGLRLEEIARLRAEHVKAGDGGRYLAITRGKSRAALRRVPVHPFLLPLVQHLAASTPDGYLWPGLAEIGLAEKRGHRLSGDFARQRKRLGLGSVPCDFHSARRCFMSAAEAGGVPEWTTQALVGHERSGLAYGTYARAADIPLPVLADAVQRVTYADDVADAARAAMIEDAETIPTLPPSRRRARQK
ncbi:MAG: DUF6538 domain-containing protein [Metallibacterium sp.]